MTRLYLSPPHLSGYEKEYIEDAIRTNWIAPLGPHVDAFEKEFAEYLGIEHVTAVSSGTAALHLSMILSEVGPGDEVICSSLTFSASANPIVYQGATPIFIDADTLNWNIDPGLLEEAIRDCAKRGKLPKAVIAVDLYGQSADYIRIEEICSRYETPLIEDAAESLGSTYKGKKTGSFGNLAIFSFNGNKIITTSGGGMLVSKNQALIQRARFLATQARDPAPHYQHSTIGYNYRMSNILASIGRGQLRVIDLRVAARRYNFSYYQKALEDVPGIGFMPEASYGESNRWLTCITVDPALFGMTREDIRLALEKENIESRPIWKPMHLQPVFSHCKMYGGSVSEKIFEKGLSLPSGTAMSDDDRERVVRVIRSLYSPRLSITTV